MSTLPPYALHRDRVGDGAWGWLRTGRARSLRFGGGAARVGAAAAGARCATDRHRDCVALGTWSGSVAERHFQGTDPGQVVLDEVLGMLITLLMNPVGWAGAAIGFVLFRVADIVNPSLRTGSNDCMAGSESWPTMPWPACTRTWHSARSFTRRIRCIGRYEGLYFAVGSEMLTPFRVDTNSLTHRAAQCHRLRYPDEGRRRRRCQ